MVRLRNKKLKKSQVQPQNDAIVIAESQNIFQKVPIYAWIFVIIIVIIIIVIIGYFLLKTNDSSSNDPNPTRLPLPTRLPTTNPPQSGPTTNPPQSGPTTNPPQSGPTNVPGLPGITVPYWVNYGYIQQYTTSTVDQSDQTSKIQLFSGDSAIIIAKTNNSSIVSIYECSSPYTIPSSKIIYLNGGQSCSITPDPNTIGGIIQNVLIKTQSIDPTSNTTYYKSITIGDEEYTHIDQPQTVPLNFYTANYGDFGIIMGSSKTETSIGGLYFFEYCSLDAPTITPIINSDIELSILGNTLRVKSSNSFRYCYRLFGNNNNLITYNIPASVDYDLYTVKTENCGFIFVKTSSGIGLAFFEWTGNVSSIGVQNILLSPSPGISFSIKPGTSIIQVNSDVGGNIKCCVVLI